MSLTPAPRLTIHTHSLLSPALLILTRYSRVLNLAGGFTLVKGDWCGLKPHTRALLYAWLLKTMFNCIGTNSFCPVYPLMGEYYSTSDKTTEPKTTAAFLKLFVLVNLFCLPFFSPLYNVFFLFL